MNRGGEISDSIPNDLIVEIFARLPASAKSALRFRSYGIHASPFIFHRAIFDQFTDSPTSLISCDI
ncbi:unnamed protein product [Brassica rapa subsp. trilocularis]